MLIAAAIAGVCLTASSALAQTHDPSGEKVADSTQSNEPWWKGAWSSMRSIHAASSGLERRRHWRSQRHHFASGLSKDARGVDAIWITPIYPSPLVDFGYDISDYENIDPAYGTLTDFDHLVAEASKRDIKIIMDMVMNHTSDKHKWFIESKSSKTNPKRDWYVWRDGKAPRAKPPNNWQSLFGHSAWQFDPKHQPVLLSRVLYSAARS